MAREKNEPGFEPESNHPEHHKEDINKRNQTNWWRNRMRSKLIRMSRGAQNFWTSLPWPHKDNWRRKNKKK